jgi:4,5:9,10-diseco-3-hydroxy-5,9,17-trioxoandrosta-1(10),2-diene-4-oate hydrolase
MRAFFTDVSGVRSRYYGHGAGPCGIVMLHGVGVSSDSFLWNLEALGTDRTAIAPDLLGYGMTGEGSYREGPPHDGIIDHLVTLLDQIGLDRVCIIGSSFGSTIACLLTLRLGARVDHLVLVGCGPALNEPPLLHEMYKKSFENGIAAMSDPTLERCERRMRNLVHDPNSVPPALPLLQLSLYGLPETRDRYERRIRGIMAPDALKKYDVSARLRDIQAPTLVVWGRQDTRGDLAEAERNFKKIPKGEMVIFENCGHLPYLERQEEFNSVVCRFIS